MKSFPVFTEGKKVPFSIVLLLLAALPAFLNALPASLKVFDGLLFRNYSVFNVRRCACSCLATATDILT